jgi:ATP-dependent DNA helicase RecG
MPSALETLVKILKLERQQGYKNNAVIGGLAAYGENWKENAHQQARKPEHHWLVNELTDLFGQYEQIEERTERHKKIGYMMDRIMNRVPPPPQYQVPVEEQPEQVIADAPKKDADRPETAQAAPERRQEAAPRTRVERGKDKRERRQPERRRDEGRRRDSRNERSDTRSGKSAPKNQLDIPAQPQLARPPRQPRQEMAPEEAADILRGLDAPVTTVKGVGAMLATSLEKLGLETINDLLFHLPRRYDDYTRLAYISKLLPETTSTVIGTVTQTQVRVGRNNRKDFYMEVDDGTGLLSVMFFGQHFLVKQIRRGKQLVISGKTSAYQNRMQMVNPEWEELDEENLHTVGIVPVYPLTEGLTSRRLRRLMKNAIDYWTERLTDYIPETVLDRAELGDLGWALKNLHFPEGPDHLKHARRRFVFDQLLLMQLAILANRRDWQSVPGHALTITDDFLEPFIETVFPYTLTGVQRSAIEDIRRDISSDVPMNRLLQGDVGSGKTAVAVAAMAMAFVNGKQSALMAPTSILAEQHYRGITETLQKMPGDEKPNIRLLTGAISNGEREGIYQGLADGSIDMVIGTHAVIQEGVEFANLAVAVIDEQHRFGVGQRGTLRGKGNNPHLLVMTATPIPRTLALTLYADLDLSIMDEMPPGRIPIQTRIVHNVERERIYNFIKSQIEKGRQAFVVHPLVEASETIDARAAVEAYEELSHVFFRYRVGLLHGRMKPAEKDDTMAAFSNHEFDILVTTSVAEVGVDIPNASIIVIEGANRFGLAQLHQFRGRVGRGQHASYCLLIPDANTPEAEERLKTMEETTDGFKLAEVDWKMRGAGDLIGTRQSGQSKLQLAEIMSPELVELAQREARTIYAEDRDLELAEHHLLAERVAMLYNKDSDVS